MDDVWRVRAAYAPGLAGVPPPTAPQCPASRRWPPLRRHAVYDRRGEPPLSSEGLTGYVWFVGSTRDAAETSASSPVSLGRVFTDPTVARLYERRPPYPEGVFAALARRLVVPRHVLDAGAGTGALARRMASFAERIDAVEPSAEMLAAGRQLIA